MKKWNLDFFQLFIFDICLSILILFVQKTFYWFVTFYKLSFNLLHILQSLPVVGGILIILFVVMRIQKITLIESIRYIGFKNMSFRQIAVCFCLITPILFGTFYTFQKYEQNGISITLMEGWPFYLFYLVVSSGFFEEVLYRGLIFQIFRKKRSFFSAALLSGLLWSFGHVWNYFYDYHETKLISVLAMFIWPVILAFPSAYLFERTGNVIWCWILIHISIDWFQIMDIGNNYPIDIVRNENIYRSISIVIMVILTVPLVRWLLPLESK